MRKYMRYLLLALLVAFFLGNFRTYMVIGESDLPTFQSGDKVIINRSAYDLTIPFSNMKFLPWRAPSRGDMVLCYLQKKKNGDFWLKRIIGLPGDTITIKANKITINSTPLKYEMLNKESLEPETRASMGDILAMETGMGLRNRVSFSAAENIISSFGPLVVAEDHYFVLGDNRFNSLDSRFLGQVPRQNLFGKYLFMIFKNN